MGRSVIKSTYKHTQPLGDYMAQIVEGSECVRSSDAKAFRHFLKTTVVGFDRPPPRIKFNEPEDSLSSIVNRSIQWILKRSEQQASSSGPPGHPSKNVLAQGYWLRKDGTNHSLRGANDVACVQLNSSVIELGTPRWQLLFERVGAGPMMHLLKHTSVFLQLRNMNYQQLLGPQITSLHTPNAKPSHMPAADNILVGSAGPSFVRRRKRSRGVGNEDSEDSEDSEDEDGRRVRRKGGDSDEYALALSLISIEIKRSSMLYHEPRLARQRLDKADPRSKVRSNVVWDLPRLFPVKAALDFGEKESIANALLGEMFVHAPAFRTNPSLPARNLVARLLKLHRKFDYRRQLFRWCPVPWQQEGERSSMPNTRSENMCDNGSIADVPALSSDPVSSGKDRHTAFSRKKRPAAKGNAKAPVPDSGCTDDSKAPSYLKMATTHHDVFMFIQKCVQGVIPHDLIGGKRNHRRLYNLIHRIIEGGRFENLTLHEVMQRFQIGDVMSWLSAKDPGCFNTYASLIHWVLVDFVLVLLRHFFYVTESAPCRYELFYFRNDVWVSIARKAWQSIGSSMYVKRTRESIVQADEMKSDVTFSRIRLMPKEHGLRTIANLGRSKAIVREGGKLVEKSAQSTNNKLADTLVALTSMRKTDPLMMGASTYSFEDVYSRLKEFKASLGLSPGTSTSNLYMAKIDIRQAFDTIPHDKLLSLLEQRLPDDEYAIYKYLVLMPSSRKPSGKFQRHGQKSNNPVEFGQLANSLAKRTRHAVYVDQCSTSYVDTQDALKTVRKHVTSNIVCNSHGLWQQRVGIPQGSTISTFLCNFFYAQLEREHLHGIVDASVLFMRMTDDFIIVSRHQAAVIRFLERIIDGVPAYGAELNREKTLVNFDANISGCQIECSESRWFPWCGLLIDSQTLDVRYDYKRMLRASLRMSLTINAGKSAGVMLRKKLLAALRTKLAPIFMDRQFNSWRIVLLNIYQHFLVCAMKLHTVYRQLPVKGKTSQCVVRVIWDFIHLACKLLRSKCGYSDIPPADIMWLALYAFDRILSQRQSRYPQVLARIHSAMGVPKYARMAARHVEIIQAPEHDDVMSIAF